MNPTSGGRPEEFHFRFSISRHSLNFETAASEDYGPIPPQPHVIDSFKKYEPLRRRTSCPGCLFDLSVPTPS